MAVEVKSLVVKRTKFYTSFDNKSVIVFIFSVRVHIIPRLINYAREGDWGAPK